LVRVQLRHPESHVMAAVLAESSITFRAKKRGNKWKNKL
jgi:hypothetical protein